MHKTRVRSKGGGGAGGGAGNLMHRTRDDAQEKQTMSRTQRGMLSRQHRSCDKKRRGNRSCNQTRTRLKKMSKMVS